MSKTITIRLSDEDYRVISSGAEHERRPISNFITHRVMAAISDMNTVDDAEMKEILSDEKVMQSINRGLKNFINQKNAGGMSLVRVKKSSPRKLRGKTIFSV
jgi:uncharacterized protein (DUF1778 family)